MLRFGILGALEVVDDSGAPVDLGGRQPRTIVALLLAASGRPVPTPVVIDTLWGESPPSSATSTVQSYVSRLRRTFGSHAELRWDDNGYRLDVDPDRVDFRYFEVLAAEGAELLASGDTAAARQRLLDALGLWRGPAFADFADFDFAAGLATRLDEARLATIELRINAELQLGRHARVVGELWELVTEHPLREGYQEQLALALYRSGRQAEALRVLADAARTLRDELGIEPSRPLRDLESAILTHDPRLEAPAPVAPRPTDPALTDPALTEPALTDAADRGSDETAPAALERFVGRDHELAELVAAFEESSESTRFVILEGEPGIGKTRLADELRTHATRAGATAVWGRSDEGGAAPALWPWLVPLRALTAQVTEVPETVTELLEGEVPSGAVQTTLQFERFEAIAELLTAATDAAPVVILLDDLQWADRTSLELLGFLAGRLEQGVLIVATVRQLEVGRGDTVTNALAAVAHRPGSRRLALRGLTADATAAVLERAAGRALQEGVAEAIHSRAEGNPFYALELGRLLDEEGGLRDEVPGTVRDVIRRRLSYLPEPTVELLGVAAVVGRDVDLGLLSRAASRSLDDTIDAIEPAVSHRLLLSVPDRPGDLRFSHALVREVLVDDLTSLRRARLHLKVADAIEAAGAGVDDAEILAEHLWRAAPVGVGQRAAQALEVAAEVAVRRVSYTTAEVLLTRAAHLRRASSATTAEAEAELAVLVRLLEVTRALRYYQAAVDTGVLDRAKELAERCGQPDIGRNLRWFEWSALATSCRIDEAAPLAGPYLAMTLEDPRPEVQAEGHEVYGVSCWGQGRIAEAAEHFNRIIELVGDAPLPEDDFRLERRVVSIMFWLWHQAVVGAMAPADVWTRFDEFVAMVPERHVVVSTCGFAGTTAITLGDWEQTARYAATAMRADPGMQFTFWAGQTQMNLGIVAAVHGDATEAIARFTDGKERYLSVDGRSGLPTFGASLALNLARLGAVDEAQRAVTAARTELEAYHERWNEPVVLLAEGAVAHAGGDHDGAAERLTEAAATARRQGALVIVERVADLAAELDLPRPG